MINLKRIGFLFLVLLFSGCATKHYVPEHSYKELGDLVSVKHPVEFVEIKAITTFEVFFDPGLLSETQNTQGGIWPILISNMRGKGQELGYLYFSSKSPLTPWGRLKGRIVILCSKRDLEKSKILCSPRIGDWLCNLKGEEIVYDSQKFDSDDSYRQEIFNQYGMTLKQIQEMWDEHIEQSGLYQAVWEFRAGTLEWQKFEGLVIQQLPATYKMPDGSLRIGVLSTREFAEQATEVSGLTVGERISRNLRLNAGPDPLISVGLSAINSALGALTDNRITGGYAISEVERGEMRYIFRTLASSYRKLVEFLHKEINSRDDEIRYLGEENFHLKLGIRGK